MKTFDFNHADFLAHSKGVKAYLKTNYKRPVSEREFVQKYPATSGRAPGRLKGIYRRLNRRFAFFTL